jgi:RecA-family ATPase
VAILEPLITLHSVGENDNGKMDQVIRTFSGIADQCDCAIGINQHTRKGSNGDETQYSVDDARGGSVLRDAVRAARALNRLTKEEAAGYGLHDHERANYIRIDRAKGNNAPSHGARWVTFRSRPAARRRRGRDDAVAAAEVR